MKGTAWVPQIVVSLNPSGKQRKLYEGHRAQVAGENGGDANIKQLYHGLGCSCDGMLPDSAESVTLCRQPSCSLCGITRDGFDLTRVGSSPLSQTPHWNGKCRWGSGIYFGEHSSKSHDYSLPHARTINGKKWCVVLVCDVICGNPAPMTKTDKSLQGPPSGHHSVHGVAGPGSCLNYPERVVYTPDAVLPTYAIWYSEQ